MSHKSLAGVLGASAIASLRTSGLARYIATWLTVTAVLIFLGIPATRISIDVTAEHGGTSQMFYGHGRHHSEENSVAVRMAEGTSTLNFDVPSFTTRMRWDPSNNDTSVTVRAFRISVFGIEFGELNPNITALNAIGKLLLRNGTALIQPTAGATDPQILLVIPRRITWTISIATTLLLAAGLACVAVLLPLAWRWREIINAIDRTPQYIRGFLEREGIRPKEIAIYFSMALVANIYFLANLSLSVDDEFAAVRGDPTIWIAQGRWTTYFVTKFLFPQPSIPFSPYIFLAGCFACSYLLIVRALRFQPGWRTYLAYPVFCAYPTWWFISEFYSNTPATALGLVFVCAAVYLYSIDQRNPDQFRPRTAITSIILLATSLGAYQSYITYYVCAGIGVLIADALENRSTKAAITKSFMSLVRLGGMAAAGMGLYYLVNRVCLSVWDLKTFYVNDFVRFSVLLQHPADTLLGIGQDMTQLYGGSADMFGASMPAAKAVIIASLILTIAHAWSKKRPELIPAWLLLIAAPFGLELMSGPRGMPLRSMMALSFASWFLSISILRVSRPALQCISIALCSLFVLQILSANSQYMAAATITQDHDRMIAADIYTSMGALDPNFNPEAPIEVDIFGYRNISTVYANPWSTAIQGSFFGWDDGNIFRTLTYMRITGYGRLVPMPPARRKEMTPIFAEMPVWPAKGSIRKVGNAFLIKMGTVPDPAHPGVK